MVCLAGWLLGNILLLQHKVAGSLCPTGNLWRLARHSWDTLMGSSVDCFSASLHLPSGPAVGSESTQTSEEAGKLLLKITLSMNRLTSAVELFSSWRGRWELEKVAWKVKEQPNENKIKWTLLRDRRDDGVYLYLLSLWIFQCTWYKKFILLYGGKSIVVVETLTIFWQALLKYKSKKQLKGQAQETLKGHRGSRLRQNYLTLWEKW